MPVQVSILHIIHQSHGTHILELVNLRLSLKDLIPPFRLNLSQLPLVISDLRVDLVVELVDLLITAIEVKLGSSEPVPQLVKALHPRQDAPFRQKANMLTSSRSSASAPRPVFRNSTSSACIATFS
jgi:hypothetical protein